MLKKPSLVLSLALFCAVLTPHSASAEECSQAARTSGECQSITSDVSSDTVTLGIVSVTPGQPGSETSYSGGSAGSAPSSPSLPWQPPPPRSPTLGTSECSIMVQGRCRGSSPSKNPPPASSPDTRVTRPPVAPSSVSDLAQFQPVGGAIQVEPGWWTLPRVHTNVFVSVREHEVAGELLGVPIEVRFTPRSFRWSLGDGNTRTTSSGGSSWGSEQFSASATSHVYRAPGTYSIGVVIEYSVSYRYVSGPFVPVTGTVFQRVNPTSVTVLRVTPVLVDQGCQVATLRDGRC